MSYSLYLWQQIFLNRRGGLIVDVTPLNLALAVALATVCYHLVKSPLLRARERLFAMYCDKGTAGAAAAPEPLTPAGSMDETP